MLRRIFQIESSQFSPRARWVPGAEIYEEDCAVEYPAHLDYLDTDTLDQMASDDVFDVRYITPADDYRAGWYLCAEGKPIERCCSDAMRAGWLASFCVDPTMRRIGVRS